MQNVEPVEPSPLDGMSASSFAVGLAETPQESCNGRVFSAPLRALKRLLRAVSELVFSTKCCLWRQKAKVSPTDTSFSRKSTLVQKPAAVLS